MGVSIGILGGTFDPVHVGHLVAAVSARDQLSLDTVLLIPNNHSPLKKTAPVAGFADRLEMLRRAVDGVPRLIVSDIEGMRDGVSYTVDTLRAVAETYTGADLYFILGSDALRDFALWKDHGTVESLARVVGILRGDDDTLPSSATHSIRMPRIDISSSMIRTRLANAESVEYLLVPGVASYIEEKGLYRRS